MHKKKVLVVGAGPGGLTAAMLLASRGYDVQVFEKADVVGGRNAAMTVDGFTFDVGPTFLMMLDILEEMFTLSGRRMADLLDVRSIDPLYRLVLGDGREFFPTRNRDKMREQIARLFPGNEDGYDRYLVREKKKLERLLPCLQVPYASAKDFLKPRLARALPYLDVHQSLHEELGRYFDHPDLKLAFTFQAKYLGMSPWKCPGLFSIISYLEHGGGVHHPIGGLNAISTAMARVVREDGGQIHTCTPVDEVIVENGRAVGLRVGGETVSADYVVINADFAHAMNTLVKREHLRKWTPEAIDTKDFSCSTFMLYLGLNRTYPNVPHHNIIFAKDYRTNVDEIAVRHVVSEDPSVYVQNACVTDPGLAPEGCSTIYLLVPITNQRSRADWESKKASYRDKVLDLVEQKAGLEGIRDHIVTERMITPADWVSRGVHLGATFNLAHSLDQMLYFRPHNEFEEFDNCYLVGGGTHPGSGLPTIYESGRISAGLILKRDGIL